MTDNNKDIVETILSEVGDPELQKKLLRAAINDRAMGAATDPANVAPQPSHASGAGRDRPESMLLREAEALGMNPDGVKDYISTVGTGQLVGGYLMGGLLAVVGTLISLLFFAGGNVAGGIFAGIFGLCGWLGLFMTRKMQKAFVPR